MKFPPLTVPILYAEPAAGVRPLNVVEHVTHDSTRAALDASLIREDHPAIFMRNIAICGTAINALLSYTLQADIAVDDANVSARAIDIIDVE